MPANWFVASSQFSRGLVFIHRLQRFGTPQEVAAIALLLAGDDAAYITGAEFTIDGGLLAGSAASPQRED